MANNTLEYMNLIRGYMGIDDYVPSALLIAETKEMCQSRTIPDDAKDRIYEMMLSIADRLNIINPFKDETQFERIYSTYCVIVSSSGVNFVEAN